MNKIATRGLASSLLALSLSAQAVDLTPETMLDINLGIASDWRVGGLSLNMGDAPVYQGNATLVHKLSGLYLGAYGVTVDMDTQANREMGYYVGIGRPITENTRFSLTYIRYEYPGDSWINFDEIIGTLSYRQATLGVKYAWDLQTPKPIEDANKEIAAAHAAQAAGQIPPWVQLPGLIPERDPHRTIGWAEYDFYLPYATKLNVRYGHTWTPDENAWRSASGKTRSGYSDWGVSLTKRMWDIEWKAAYIDTDLSEAECQNNFGKGGDCQATVVFSAMKNF